MLDRIGLSRGYEYNFEDQGYAVVLQLLTAVLV
jgi:hypothetical protein